MKKLFIMGLLLTQILSTTTFASMEDPKDIKYSKEKPSFELRMDENTYKKDYSKVFDKMKKDMTSIKVTGNVDIDFLNGMIPHHEGAVAMSEAILKNTNNADVKKLAQSIISEQKAGIKTMQALLENVKKDNAITDKDADMKYIREYEEDIDGMFKGMSAVKPSKDPSVDYLNQMVPHHEGGIEMAQNVLKYSTNPEVKKIAENIISTQKSQIPMMKDLSKKLSSATK